MRITKSHLMSAFRWVDEVSNSSTSTPRTRILSRPHRHHLLVASVLPSHRRINLVILHGRQCFVVLPDKGSVCGTSNPPPPSLATVGNGPLTTALENQSRNEQFGPFLVPLHDHLVPPRRSWVTVFRRDQSPLIICCPMK